MANTAIFSITDKLLLRSLAVKDPEQLFLITSVSVSPHFVSNAFSYPDFSDYRKQNKILAGLTVFNKTELQLKTSEGAERVQSEYVGGNYFDVLGVAAADGRTFAPDEDASPGSQPVVVVSENFRRRRFGDESPIGKSLTLNNVPLTIVGVAPAEFRGMFLEEPTDIWVPVLMHPQLAQSKFIEKRTNRFLNLLARTKAGVPVEQSERD